MADEALSTTEQFTSIQETLRDVNLRITLLEVQQEHSNLYYDSKMSMLMPPAPHPHSSMMDLGKPFQIHEDRHPSFCRRQPRNLDPKNRAILWIPQVIRF